MSPSPIIRAAQYLRMSTEHQQYSLDNQAAAIQEYAHDHSFTIVCTYEDSGRSGLLLKRRLGLQRLLSDIVNGKPDYAAILVYDVSRWGRFQDADEAAHYEFLCKHAGIPVHYCAEPFANDNTVSSSILKALKRTMAAEYSRELGLKTYAGKKRLVQLGFRVGGQAGYGLRRVLVSADGKRKQRLRDGEHKSLMTDRVVLVPGPKKEVECVRHMFQMALRKPYIDIVRDLNARRIPYLRGEPWTFGRVTEVLTNPKYTGCNVWGRTTAKLRSKPRAASPEQWVVTPGAFRAIVDQQTFDRVQAAHPKRNLSIPDQELLEKLRRLLARTGKLSVQVLKKSRGAPCPQTYANHFGSVRRAFELIEYPLTHKQLAASAHIARRKRLLKVLLDQIESFFPTQARVCSLRNRPALRLEDGLVVAITICRYYKTRKKNDARWELILPPRDRDLVTLLCLSNPSCDGFQSFYVMRGINMGAEYQIKGESDRLLQRGHRLGSLADLLEAARNVAQPAGHFPKLSREAQRLATV